LPPWVLLADESAQRLFPGKFLSCLEEAFRSGQLAFHGQQEHLADATLFLRRTQGLREREWGKFGNW
jgi:hypothetical protein